MKAFSILQPWAWCVVNGYKDVENRDWRPGNPGLRFRGSALIHTGKGFDREGYGTAAALLDAQHSTLPPIEYFDRGGIVGIATFAGVVEDSPSPWFFGPVGLVIHSARKLCFVPCKGALGFFEVPDEIARQALGEEA